MGAATTDLVRRDRRLGDGRRGERHAASKLRGFWHVHVLMRQSLSWGPPLSLQIDPHRFNGVEDRELRGSGPGRSDAAESKRAAVGIGNTMGDNMPSHMP
jgi:hypothetical protein